MKHRVFELDEIGENQWLKILQFNICYAFLFLWH